MSDLPKKCIVLHCQLFRDLPKPACLVAMQDVLASQLLKIPYIHYDFMNKLFT